MANDPPDAWGRGDAYEPYVGRWSRLVAREFVEWLDIGPGRRWLDVGCGTGALTQAILDQAEPAHVVGVEPSEAYAAHARARFAHEPRVRIDGGHAFAIPAGDGEFAVAASGLVLNFVPDPARAVRESCRVTRPGGLVAAYVWDYAGRMQLMRYFWDAAVALDPAARDLDEGRRFPLASPERLAELFGGARLDSVDVRAIDVPTVFRDFDDYWSPFLGGQGPAPSYCVALPQDRRTALRERLRAALPTRPDGTIPLIARAWAVRGVRR